MNFIRQRLVYIIAVLVFAANLAVGSTVQAAISAQDEIELGRSVAREIEKRYGLVKDSALQDRIARIGERIAADCDRKDLTYSFKVLDDKEINAFALPGGFVYINKGLADYLSTDEELAGVIGHEIAHIVRRHSIRQMEKAQGYLIGMLLLFGDKGLAVQQVALSAIMAGYSRADESEADYLGFVYTMRAGYNPYCMLLGLQRLQDLGGKANFDLFDDHPDTATRVKKMQEYLQKNNIQPMVTQNGQAAAIVAPSLNLPPLYATYRGLKPLYRAELAAGALYNIAKLPEFSGDRFIVDSNEIYTTIYYEDKEIVTLTPQDASSNNATLESLAEQYIAALKRWADHGGQ